MIYIILSVLIIIILACLCVYLVYPIREKFKTDKPHNWMIHGTTPPSGTESQKPYNNKAVADGNPYIDTVPLDPTKTLTNDIII